MVNQGRQTRLYHRAQYFRRGFADVANPAWLAHLSEEEQRAYGLRESFRAVHRELARNARKSHHFGRNESQGDISPDSLSPAAREIAGNAFAEYVRLLKKRRSKAAV